MNRNILSPHRLSGGRISNASAPVDDIKLKFYCVCEEDVEKRCYLHNVSNATTNIATHNY